MENGKENDFFPFPGSLSLKGKKSKVSEEWKMEKRKWNESIKYQENFKIVKIEESWEKKIFHYSGTPSKTRFSCQ